MLARREDMETSKRINFQSVPLDDTNEAHLELINEKVVSDVPSQTPSRSSHWDIYKFH